jgi:hypothetical protein
MSIICVSQYNFNIDKYKLLSTISGAGAILTTKTGHYILVSSIDKWPFIIKAKEIISNERKRFTDEMLLDQVIRRIKDEIGLNNIEDKRFIEFLKISSNLLELELLLEVPEIELNEIFNTPEWKEHPIKKLLPDAISNNYMVQAYHFPKWFIGNGGRLQTLDNWRKDWSDLILKGKNNRVRKEHFAPPRDSKSLFRENYKRKINSDGNYEEIDIYNELTQNNLALICKNGHLMDIPWSKFINLDVKRLNSNDYLIDFSLIQNCCGNPNLKWSESSNKSEGFENIFVECTSCQTKKNLGGINSLKCKCEGHKPWEVELNKGFNVNIEIPKEKCEHDGKNGIMQFSLVTAKKMYYAVNEYSLFIPINTKPEGFENQEFAKALQYCMAKYDKVILRKPNLTKEEWFNEKVDQDTLIEDVGINENIVSDLFFEELKNNFLNLESTNEKSIKEYDEENYRLFEFKCLIDNEIIDQNGLRFTSVNLPIKLQSFFKSVKQLYELKVTQVQLSFNRIEPRTMYKGLDGKKKYTSGCKNIFEGIENEQFVLPAIQNYGEGIFFQFNETILKEFILDSRFEKIINKNLTINDQGFEFWDSLKNCGQKYFIIHSFSHLILRELEFSCGYPTSSLKERLYISSEGKEFMAGVLIYTTDGSEGSMGGLVSQASENNIENLVKNALIRGIDCSSDPLCWESEGQGLFNFNLASCFSCSLVSEVACESMNLGLDRRILVDENIGFFKDLLFD